MTHHAKTYWHRFALLCAVLIIPAMLLAAHHTSTQTTHHTSTTTTVMHTTPTTLPVPADCRVERYQDGSSDAICYSDHAGDPLPPTNQWPSVNCYDVNLDKGLDGVTTLRAQGHTIEYIHGTWYVDHNAAEDAPTEDSPVTLCTTYPGDPGANNTTK